MTIKKKLGMSIATGALAIGLIGGGTYAYFSDTANAEGQFTTGILEIDVSGKGEQKAVVNLDNLKPGDTIRRDFELKNTGTLNVSEVLLTSVYKVNDANRNNGDDDFGEHIKVKFLKNSDKENQVIYETTLKDFSSYDVVEGLVKTEGGLTSGETNNLSVLFEFVDNGENQNIFQGDSLELDWTFEAKQTAGVSR